MISGITDTNIVEFCLHVDQWNQHVAICSFVAPHLRRQQEHMIRRYGARLTFNMLAFSRRLWLNLICHKHWDQLRPLSALSNGD